MTGAPSDAHGASTESARLTALRAFIRATVGGEVIQSQQNRAAVPKGEFAALTPLRTEGLSTVQTAYLPPEGRGSGQATLWRGAAWTVQIDFYGSHAADRATRLATLFRSDAACAFFTTSGADLQPLYAGEPRHLPFLNAEQQFEPRWMVEVTFQFTPAVRLPSTFASIRAIRPMDRDALSPLESGP